MTDIKAAITPGRGTGDQAAPEPTLNFLRALFPVPGGLIEIRPIFRIRGERPTTSVFVADPAELDWPRLAALNRDGYNIYFGAGLRARRAGTKRDILSVGALWGDLDPGDFNKEDEGHGRRLAFERLEALPPALAPSVVVDSGHGCQPYWLLAAPLLMTEAANLARAEAAMKALAALLNGDSVQNVDRVMRLPGTANVKSKVDPKPCTVVRADYGRRFVLEDLEALIQAASGPRVTVAPAASVPTDATVPQLPVSDRIRRLVVEGWRPGEGYPSRSEADAAVIAALVNAGLSDANIRLVFRNETWHIGEAYREKGDAYLDRSIASARAWTAEHPAASAPEPGGDAGRASESELAQFSRPLSALLADTEQPPAFLVHKLVREGSVGFIAGEPKSLKSWLSLDLAFGVATGRSVFGAFAVPRPGRVLLVQEEDDAAMVRQRLCLLARAAGGLWPSDENFRVAVRTGLEIFPGREADENVNNQFLAFERDVLRHRPDLIIVDALHRLHAGDENSQREMVPVMRRFEALRRRTNCAVLLVHHFRKASREKSGRGSQRLRGSSALAAWSDNSLYVLSRSREDVLSISPESKYGPVEDFFVRMEQVQVDDSPGVRFCLVADGASGRQAENREKVYEVLVELHRQMPDMGTVSMIRARTKLSEGTVRNHLRELEDAHRVHRAASRIAGKGQELHVFSPVKPKQDAVATEAV